MWMWRQAPATSATDITCEQLIKPWSTCQRHGERPVLEVKVAIPGQGASFRHSGSFRPKAIISGPQVVPLNSFCIVKYVESGISLQGKTGILLAL
jgi:hypothetical protein